MYSKYSKTIKVKKEKSYIVDRLTLTMMTVSLLRSGFLVHRSSSSRSILRPFASSWNWNDPKKSATTTASGESFAPLSVDAQIQKQVLDKCAALHSSIMPLNEKVGLVDICVCVCVDRYDHSCHSFTHSLHGFVCSFEARWQRIPIKERRCPLSFSLGITVQVRFAKNTTHAM